MRALVPSLNSVMINERDECEYVALGNILHTNKNILYFPPQCKNLAPPPLHMLPSVLPLGMAPAGAGAGLAKTRPQANPRDWKKPAREQTRGYIFAPAPADFGRVSGARGSNNRYNKNVQIHQFKQSNNTFL